MLKTVLMASAMTMAFVAGAQAAGMAARGADAQGQFYATPLQKGAPTDLPGERLIPGASETAAAIDVVVQPTLVPINQLGTGVGTVVAGVIDPTPAAAPAAEPAPVRHHHHRHHLSRKHLSKKAMHIQ